MGDPPAPAPPSWQQTFEYYNPLHFRSNKSKHHSKTPPVYSRDFAYAENGPQVLAHPMRIQRADINAETSARSFAEYVHPSTLLVMSV